MECQHQTIIMSYSKYYKVFQLNLANQKLALVLMKVDYDADCV